MTDLLSSSSWHGSDRGDPIGALLRSLARNRAHVIVSDPSMAPDCLRDPMIEGLQNEGEPLRTLDPGRPSRSTRGAVLLDLPDLPVRRFWLEMRELDKRARRGNGMVLATWQLGRPAEAEWTAWLGEVVGSVIRVREPVFDVPPEVVPTRYRIPVEVFIEGRLNSTFSLWEEI